MKLIKLNIIILIAVLFSCTQNKIGNSQKSTANKQNFKFSDTIYFYPKSVHYVRNLFSPEYEKNFNKFNDKIDYFNIEQKVNFYFTKGLLNYINHKYQASLTMFEKCLEFDKNDLKSIYCIAHINSQLINNKNLAEETYLKAIDLINNMSDDLLEQSYYFQLQDEKLFGPILDIDNLLYWCYIDLEEITYKKKDIATSIKCLEAARKIRPDELFLLSKLVDYYQETGKFSNAMELLSTLVEKYPKEYKFIFQKGYIFYKLENYELSIKDFSIAIDLAKKNSVDNKLNELTNLYKMQKTFTSELAQAYYYRALSFEKLKKYQAAIADLNRVVEIEKNFEPAYYYRAYFSNYSGDKDQALKDFQKVYELNPNRTSVLYSIALIYDTKENYKKAVEYFNKFLKFSYKIMSQKYKNAQERVEKINKFLNQ